MFRKELILMNPITEGEQVKPVEGRDETEVITSWDWELENISRIQNKMWVQISYAIDENPTHFNRQ